MSNRVRVIAVTSSLLALALSPANAAAVNHAKFNIVIEGNASAHRHFELTGQASVCKESLHGTFNEETRFLRGRGVTIELVRKKRGAAYEYGLKRVGVKSAITVVASSTRTATGAQEIKRAPEVPVPVLCPEEGSKELSGLGDCGVAHASREDLGLQLEGANSFTVAHGDLISPGGAKKNVCGETSLDKGFIELNNEWPDYIPVAAEPIPDAKLFSGVKAVKETLLGSMKYPPSPLGEYPLTGTGTDEAFTNITVRFIRCGAKHYPAC